MEELSKERDSLINEQIQKKKDLLKLPVRIYEPGSGDASALIIGDQMSTLGELIE